MAKKRVSVYMREEDLEWLGQHPAAESVSGSAVLLMEWAVRQIQRGQVDAIEQLDDGEKRAIAKYAKSAPVTADQSPETVSKGVFDWLRLQQSMNRDTRGLMGEKWDGSQISKLTQKINDMTPAEVIGLMCWARGTACREGRRDTA